ncbi:MAG: YlmC/YmxH family sporulation protein [Bacillota bacterium]|jgi:YlmC/YmxH family sporulation protein
MLRVGELRMREVVNVLDGKRLGMIIDLDIDLAAGRVKGLLVPGQARVLGIFGRESEIYIAWEQVVKIGEDVILVELDGNNSYQEGGYSRS